MELRRIAAGFENRHAHSRTDEQAPSGGQHRPRKREVGRAGCADLPKIDSWHMWVFCDREPVREYLSLRSLVVV